MVLIEKDNYQLHFIVFSALSFGPAVDAIEKHYSGYGTGKVALVVLLLEKGCYWVFI